MASDIQLAQLSKTGALAYIIASIIVISAANKTEKASLAGNPQGNSSQNNNGPTTEQMIAAASKLFLTGSIIFLSINLARFNASGDNQGNNSNQSLVDPQLIIVTGWIISVAGAIMRVFGNEQNARQSVASSRS